MHAGIERLRLAAVQEDEALLAGRIRSAEIGLLGGTTARGAKRGGEITVRYCALVEDAISCKDSRLITPSVSAVASRNGQTD
jgi:hypothetical protein